MFRALRAFRRKILGPGLLLGGLVATYRGYENTKFDARLKAEGSITKGLILKHEIAQTRKRSLRHRLTTRYGPPTRPITQNFIVTEEFYAANPDGKEIDIRFIPADPQIAQVEGQVTDGKVDTVIGVLFSLLGMIVSYFGLWRPRAARK